MHDLYELKEMLCKELEEYGRKGEMTAGTLDVVDKLAHTVKNLDKIIESYESEGYSNNGGMMGNGYNGGSYGNGSMTGGSYARGRNARRDAMGRYSNTGYSRADSNMEMELRDLMNNAPDERTRSTIERMLSRM